MFVIASLLMGCAGLPEPLTRQVEGMPDRLLSLETRIEQEQTFYEQLSSHKDWGFIKSYLEKEKWSAL